MKKEKNTKIIGRFGCVVIFAISLIFVAVGSAGAQNVKLTLSTYFNPGYTFILKPTENFAKKVEERSKGRVKIEIFHSAQLYKDKEEIPACERGDIDITMPLDTYSEGYIPQIGIASLPFLFKDNEAMQRSLDGGLWDKVGVRQALLQRNVVLLGGATAGGYQIYSKEAVTAPDQFKGKIWAASGGTPRKIIQAMGGAPTTMGSGELYLALQRKTVDATTRPLVTGAGRKLHEVVSHLTVTDMYFCNNVFMMNKKSFEKLPKDLQEIVQKAAKERDQEQLKMILDYERDVIGVYKTKGITVHIPDAAQLNAFKKAVAPVITEWEATIPGGKEFVEYARTHQ
jgi:tripartite ATP-independent transporter DctP family solute receptor